MTPAAAGQAPPRREYLGHLTALLREIEASGAAAGAKDTGNVAGVGGANRVNAGGGVAGLVQPPVAGEGAGATVMRADRRG